MLASSAAAPTATRAKTPTTRATRSPRFFWGFGSTDMECSFFVRCGVRGRSAEVADGGVAADAGDAAPVGDVVHQLGVAAAAIALDHLAALRTRADVLRVAAEREGHRVVVAVQGLHHVLRDEAGGG